MPANLNEPIVRSGWFSIYNTSGTLRSVGLYSQSWSSRAYSADSLAYHSEYSDENLDPSNLDIRADAFPLRCLSTVLGM